MAVTRKQKRAAVKEGNLLLLDTSSRDMSTHHTSSRGGERRKRRKYETSDHSTTTAISTLHIHELPDEILQLILSFIGNGHYIFLASTSKQFRAAIQNVDKDCITNSHSYIPSKSCLNWTINYFQNEPESKYDKILSWSKASKHDNVYAFQQIMTFCKDFTNRNRFSRWNWTTIYARRSLYNGKAVNILKWIIEETKWDYTQHIEDITGFFVLYFNIQMIQYLHRDLKIEFGYKCLQKYMSFFQTDRVRPPGTDVLSYLLEMNVDGLTEDQFRWVSIAVIDSGYHDVMTAMRQSFPHKAQVLFDWMCMIVAEEKDMDTLTVLFDETNIGKGVLKKSSFYKLLVYPIVHGRVDIFKYLHEIRPITESKGGPKACFQIASMRNQRDIMNYLYRLFPKLDLSSPVEVVANT